MAERKLESYFINANYEYHQMVQDLQQCLNPEVSSEVIALVQKMTDEAMTGVWDRLQQRYEQLRELEDSFPEKPEKEDQSNYLKEFFRLTDPGMVAADLKQALNFDSLEEEYREFIGSMSTQEYGEIFKRYTYPAHFFNGLKAAVLHHIDQLTSALKTYAEIIGQHAILLDSIHQGNKDKAFIKGGASLLGMLIGIPFAGAGVGALMGGNDETRINGSLNKVFGNWNTYVDHFNEFLGSLEENYQLAMMTIYGGTILRVNDQLEALHFTFEEMALLSCNYSLTLTKKERKDTREWVEETTAGITELIKRKSWREAIKVSKELIQIISQRPITARTELYDGKSAMYIANLFYYSSFQEALLEEYRNGHVDSFYHTVQKLYKELPLLVKDKDLETDYSPSGELVFRFVKEALKRGNQEDLRVFLEYLQRISERFDNRKGYIGEFTDTASDFSKEYKTYLALEKFLSDVFSIELDIHNDDPEIHLSRSSLKELRKIDKEIGDEDELTRYLKKQYLKSFLIPRKKISFNWLASNKKKVISAAILALLLIFGMKYADPIIERSKNGLAALQSNEAEVTAEEQTELITLRITSEYGNIRSNPSLDSDIVQSVNQTEELQYLNEEQQDTEGRSWFHVKLSTGEQGWISSKITERITVE
ncbi:SH3 domain-containing protein [Rossellomorea vietnamensis]|uniref:SH3 domain-containing protein n=1 Tax=Rossellomorea vietnamensis TaxID=218284 RepID=A0A5D4M157_9BACI|nr:SH3 domain-containing protein [Rossellomorea vietnamensis]TYR95539.1 SH3 domain-containing protein [Rossellomorea vietnamensis]